MIVNIVGYVKFYDKKNTQNKQQNLPLKHQEQKQQQKAIKHTHTKHNNSTLAQSSRVGCSR